MFYTLGMDVGCSAIKSVVMSCDEQGAPIGIVASHLDKIRKRNIKDVAERSCELVLADAKIRQDDVAYLATTGEGEMVEFRRGHFYSMTTHARGALYLCPDARGVVDVGALHAKAMIMDERSKVLNHRMTSQCASGSGQFLENIARYLGVAIEEVGSLSLQADDPELVSGICAVLAETDVINMVSRGISAANILKGIHLSIAKRLINLVRTLRSGGVMMISGGLAADIGFMATMQELADAADMGVTFKSHPQSAFAGAIGAAAWAGFRHVKLAELEEAQVA